MKHYCDGSPQYGLNTGSDAYTSGGVRLLRTTDIGNDGSLTPSSDGVFVPRELVERRYELLPGDLLFSRAGSLGRCLRVPTEAADLTFAGYLVRFRPGAASEPRYLEYCASSAFFQSEIAAGAITSTISNFNAERYGNLLVPELNLDEQRRIADFLDVETARIDALIDAKQQMIAVLLDSRREVTFAGVAGLMMNEGDRRLSVLHWVADLPSNWGEAKLALLARLGSGHTPSRSRLEWWVDPVIPWITTGEVAQMRTDRIEWISRTREQISELGVTNSSAQVHPAGTVVLCRTASAGYSAIMDEPMATSQDFATWTCGPRLLPRFLLLCLRAMRSDLLDRLAMGSTHKTIYMPDIESIRVPVPPIADQQEVVAVVWERLHQIDSINDALTEQVDLLRERRSALITAAVSGELEL